MAILFKIMIWVLCKDAFDKIMKLEFFFERDRSRFFYFEAKNRFRIQPCMRTVAYKDNQYLDIWIVTIKVVNSLAFIRICGE